jgi:hypothetical protein
MKAALFNSTETWITNTPDAQDMRGSRIKIVNTATET